MAQQRQRSDCGEAARHLVKASRTDPEVRASPVSAAFVTATVRVTFR